MTVSAKIRHVWNKLRFYLSFLLLAFYLIIGGVFLFSDVWADLLPSGRSIIGIVLILFGILRFYIAYRRYANKIKRIENIKAINEDVTAE